MLDEVLFEFEENLEKSLSHYQQELGKLRTGRAQAGLFDGIKVDYYGALTPLKQMASINVPDPKMVVIQPFDQTQTMVIEKAIKAADLGLNPIVDGKVVRVPIPALTEERRRDLVKVAKKMCEDCKVSMRSHRHKANDVLKKGKEAGDVPEDTMHKGLDKIQDLLKDYSKKTDEALNAKEKEIMDVG